MFRCELCPYETDVREKFAGHRSGHVRRGEIKPRPLVSHVCKECGLSFESGRALGSHTSRHRSDRRTFDELRTDKCRKRRLIDTQGHRCEVCHNDTWMGQPIPLQLDHVDGDSDNNLRQNVRLLCPNCHAQTPTYCGKNKGKHSVKSKRSTYMQRHFDKISSLHSSVAKNSAL